jgi:hypothetical protein
VGVSVYVMPLRTYLSGAFQATWETRGDLAGGEGGLRSTEGGIPPAPKTHRRSEEEVHSAVETFRAELATQAAVGSDGSDWDEEGPVRSASTLSYDSFVGPCQRALRWSYRLKLPRLCEMIPPQLWIPFRFGPTVRVKAPWNPDAQIAVASSPGIVEEFDRMLEWMVQDPLMEELEGLSDGSILTGLLSDFHGELETARHLRRIAAQGVLHRVPVIVEG